MDFNFQEPIINLPVFEYFPNDDSKYMNCQVCKKGVIPGIRDSKTLKLQHNQNCILCGQRYYFESLGDFEKD